MAEREVVGESNRLTADLLEQRVNARRWIELDGEYDAITKRVLVLNCESEEDSDEREIQKHRIQVEIRQEISQISLQIILAIVVHSAQLCKAPQLTSEMPMSRITAQSR